MKELPTEVFWYGRKEPLSEPEFVSSGPLEVTYEPGLIRNIRIGGFEVLRMVYFALRDHNWGTLTPIMKNHSIKKSKDSFNISLECHYNERGIKFVTYAKISGDKTGKIIFLLEGKALTDFKTNRIGFCVLHPIIECRGKLCEITTPEGAKENMTFPELISPHQPSCNISQMSWYVDKIGKATISFEGDIFEMEYQRNWTDDSYKTYCRPLELPFPYLLKKGEKVQQKITFSVSQKNIVINKNEDEYYLKFKSREELRLPEVGIGKSSLRSNLSASEIELLRRINFDFYEFDLEFNSNWQSELNQAIKEAVDLGSSLSLKIHFSTTDKKRISLLSDFLNDRKSLISSILILNKNSIVPSNAFIEEISKRLRLDFPNSRIGAGTVGFFADINRNRIGIENVDFISYSINPQVHAFDNLSLIENLHGQGETVRTAISFAGGKEIHIKPVSLRMQVNPAATSEEGSSKSQLEKIDPRQMSLFGADWTLGSLKNLTQSGASSMTFYETIGEKGIIQGNHDPINPDSFPSGKNAIFPMFYVFKDFLKDKSARYIRSISSHPTIFEGLVLKSNGKKVILLANFTNKQIDVRVDEIDPSAQVKKLDEKSVQRAMYNHDEYIDSLFCPYKVNRGAPTFKIRPFGIVLVKE